MKNGRIFKKVCEGYLIQTEMDFDSSRLPRKTYGGGAHTHVRTHKHMWHTLLYVNTAVFLAVTSDKRFCVAESCNTEL